MVSSGLVDRLLSVYGAGWMGLVEGAPCPSDVSPASGGKPTLGRPVGHSPSRNDGGVVGMTGPWIGSRGHSLHPSPSPIALRNDGMVIFWAGHSALRKSLRFRPLKRFGRGRVSR